VAKIRSVEAAGSSTNTETCSSETGTHSAVETSVTNLSFSLLQTPDLLSEQAYLTGPTAKYTREQQIFPGDGNPVLHTHAEVVKVYKVCWIRTSLFVHYTESFENSEDTLNRLVHLRSASK
jgi:hypothetical protein